MERHGYRSAQAERLREDYRDRLEAVITADAVLSPELLPTPQLPPYWNCAKTTAVPTPLLLKRPQTLEENQAPSAGDWLRMRQEAANASSAKSPSQRQDRRGNGFDTITSRVSSINVARPPRVRDRPCVARSAELLSHRAMSIRQSGSAPHASVALLRAMLKSGDTHFIVKYASAFASRCR